MHARIRHIESSYIDGILEGTNEVLNEIYSRFFPRISRMICLNSGSEEDAQDVFQDAILIIYDKANCKGFELTSGFYSLLYGICRNLWLKKLHQRKRRQVTFQDTEEYSSETGHESVENHHLRRLLFDAKFNELKSDCQKILRMFFEKTSMSMIADKMGFGSESYAKKRKFLCKQALIKLIKADPRYKELMDHD